MIDRWTQHMTEIGDGYGSECHLLRFLGRHREYFNKRVSAEIGADAVRWLDFHFDRTKRWMDGERKGLDFLPNGHPALTAWSSYWPSRGNPPNWDAVGEATFQGRNEWLLLEAKAHLGELVSNCRAREGEGRLTITKALERAKNALGVSLDRDWLHQYYQFANRLAILNFLRENGVAARLLFVYFVGDNFDRLPTHNAECPKDQAGWETALSDQARWLGLDKIHPLSNYVHKLFVPVVMD
jgi:hypothetical protein